MAAKKRNSAPKPAAKPNRTGRSLTVWIASELREALDTYISKQRVPPDLTAVVRIALEEFLAREGCWPPNGPPPV